MAEEPINYERVIADLEARRTAFNAAIDASIQNLRTVLAFGSAPVGGVVLTGVQAKGGTGTVTAPIYTGAAPTPDTFFGLSIAEAAIRWLSIVKKQQTTREIVDGLEAANYHHTSQNFINTVNTALYRRERDEADVVKIGRNWALAEWYPGRRRNRQTLAIPADHNEPMADDDVPEPEA